MADATRWYGTTRGSPTSRGVLTWGAAVPSGVGMGGRTVLVQGLWSSGVKAGDTFWAGLSRVLMEPLLEEIARWQRDDMLGRPDSDLVRALMVRHWRIPTVRRPAMDASESPFGVDVFLEWPVEGPSRLFNWWPTGADSAIVPTNEIMGAAELERTYGADPRRVIAVRDRRFVLNQLADGGTVIQGAATVPHAGGDARQRARDAVEAETRLLRGYVDATRGAAELNRPAFESAVTEAVEARRSSLSLLHAVNEALDLPRQEEPPLEVVREAPAGPSGAAPRTAEMARHALTEPSVANLHRVMVRWREKVQKYPIAYGALNENQLSDLLAVTLALAFGTAEREAFSREGKTDVYVPVGDIVEIAGGERTGVLGFVVEAKVGSGEKLAADAKAQLDGYLPLDASDAALAFYIVADDGDRAEERILAGLRDLPDYLGDDPGGTDILPVVRYGTDRGDVRVGLLFVHLARK